MQSCASLAVGSVLPLSFFQLPALRAPTAPVGCTSIPSELLKVNQSHRGALPAPSMAALCFLRQGLAFSAYCFVVKGKKCCSNKKLRSLAFAWMSY